jgi:signal transduction histidine kinase
MPAWWIGQSPTGITESVCDMLLTLLRADAAYVRARHPGGGAITTVVGTTAEEVAEGLKGVPVRGLRFAGQTIGVSGDLGLVAAGSSRADFPDRIEQLLLHVMANQAATALRHAALLSCHERAEHQLTLQATRQATVASLGLRAVGSPLGERLLDDALVSVSRTLQVDFADVLELVEGNRSLLLRAGIGWTPGSVGQAQVGVGADTLPGYTLQVREPVLIPDLPNDARFGGSTFLLNQGVVSSVTVVIHDHRGPFGVLGAHTRAPRTFSTDEVHFLQAVANVLAAAVQRHHVEAERERLLLQMRRAVAARDRAVSIVSHDLGNPLSTIQICANALLDREPPPVAGMRHMARIIQQSVTWMQQIVQDLLDRTSLDAGRLVLERQPSSVPDVIGAAQVMFAPVAQEQEIRFVVECDPHLPQIHADARRLLQVLSNLLGNAMKFTPPGGRVELSAGPGNRETGGAFAGAPGGAVRFQVSDSGPGISSEDLEHIFDWFWHSERSGRSGSGLGLAIAAGLVEAHAGRLHVRSAPGEGSAFWFNIPAVGGAA